MPSQQSSVRWSDVFRDPMRFYFPHQWSARLSKKELSEGYFSSARNFEANTGLHGIAGHYTLPGTMTPETLEAWMRGEGAYFAAAHDIKQGGLPPFSSIPSVHAEGQARLPISISIIEAIKSANPSLAALQFDPTDRIKVTQVLAGITYDSNPDDIQYFIERGTQYRNADHAEMLTKVHSMTGAHMYWVPSPKTLEKIIQDPLLQGRNYIKTAVESTGEFVKSAVPTLPTSIKAGVGAALGFAGTAQEVYQDVQAGNSLRSATVGESVLRGTANTVSAGTCAAVAAESVFPYAATLASSVAGIPSAVLLEAGAAIVGGAMCYTAQDSIIKTMNTNLNHHQYDKKKAINAKIERSIGNFIQ